MTPSRVLPRLALLGAALLTLDALAPDAAAGIGAFFSGVSARGRIVQVCVVVAGLSLLIILKKFSPGSRAFSPKVNYALSERRGDSPRSSDEVAGPRAGSPGRRADGSPCHRGEEQP